MDEEGLYPVAAAPQPEFDKDGASVVYATGSVAEHFVSYLEGGFEVNLTKDQFRAGNWLHAPDYAARFNIPVEMVYAWVKSGEIPYATFQGRVMIHQACGRRERWRGRNRG